MSNKNTKAYYVLGDGNRVGDYLASLLLNERLGELSKTSESLLKTISTMKKMAIQTMNAKIIMAGGDDLFFIVDKSRYSYEKLSSISDYFEAQTSLTFSFGVATSPTSAYLNLRKAKVMERKIFEVL